MLFKDFPKRNWIITGIVFAIGLIIALYAFFPLLKLSEFTIGFILGFAIVIAGFPLVKYFIKNKKGVFEKRNGRKLN